MSFEILFCKIFMTAHQVGSITFRSLITKK